jgi:hypothetical protein
MLNHPSCFLVPLKTSLFGVAQSCGCCDRYSIGALASIKNEPASFCFNGQPVEMFYAALPGLKSGKGKSGGTSGFVTLPGTLTSTKGKSKRNGNTKRVLRRKRGQGV